MKDTMMMVCFSGYFVGWLLVTLAVGGTALRQGMLGFGTIAAIIAAVVVLQPESLAIGFHAGVAIAAIGCVTAFQLWDRMLTRQLKRWQR